MKQRKHIFSAAAISIVLAATGCAQYGVPEDAGGVTRTTTRATNNIVSQKAKNVARSMARPTRGITRNAVRRPITFNKPVTNGVRSTRQYAGLYPGESLQPERTGTMRTGNNIVRSGRTYSGTGKYKNTVRTGAGRVTMNNPAESAAIRNTRSMNTRAINDTNNNNPGINENIVTKSANNETINIAKPAVNTANKSSVNNKNAMPVKVNESKAAESSNKRTVKKQNVKRQTAAKPAATKTNAVKSVKNAKPTAGTVNKSAGANMVNRTAERTTAQSKAQTTTRRKAQTNAAARQALTNGNGAIINNGTNHIANNTVNNGIRGRNVNRGNINRGNIKRSAINSGRVNRSRAKTASGHNSIYNKQNVHSLNNNDDTYRLSGARSLGGATNRAVYNRNMDRPDTYYDNLNVNNSIRNTGLRNYANIDTNSIHNRDSYRGISRNYTGYTGGYTDNVANSGIYYGDNITGSPFATQSPNYMRGSYGVLNTNRPNALTGSAGTMNPMH